MNALKAGAWVALVLAAWVFLLALWLIPTITRTH